MDDDEDELSEEEEEDELEEEEQNDKSENVSTRSSKSLKKPGNKSIQKKKAPKNVDDQAESDEDMPFKHQTRRGPKGRPPRTTDFRFVDPRLKEIYLLSQPYVVTA